MSTEIRTLTRLRLPSVARFAAVFWCAAAAVGALAGALLYVGLAATGSLHSVERSVQLFLPGMAFTPEHLGSIAVVLSVLLVAFGTAACVGAAILYNAVAESFGGVEVETAERGLAAAPVPVTVTDAPALPDVAIVHPNLT